MTNSATNSAPGSNGNGNIKGFWRDLSMREVFLLFLALGPSLLFIGGATWQLHSIQTNYVTKTELLLMSLNSPQGVTAEQIKELTDQLKSTSQEVEALRQIEEKHTAELQRQNDALLRQEGRR